MTGLHTNCCCRHSTADLFQRGYEVFWVMDAMQAITSEMHEEGLQYFATWYASRPDLQLLTTEQVLTRWNSELMMTQIRHGRISEAGGMMMMMTQIRHGR